MTALGAAVIGGGIALAAAVWKVWQDVREAEEAQKAKQDRELLEQR